MAFKPIKNFEWTYDTRYINWTDVKITDETRQKAVSDGETSGFSRQAPNIHLRIKKIMISLKLRLGYNYGKSPIQSSVVFANALIPVIMEHHLTTGFSYFLMKRSLARFCMGTSFQERYDG